ncbi:unnamed protein product [Cuscuta epithymum]|uniref:DNA repair protein UVH3 n=1 Tax=Cuscuta epithymum TaxID=186058 RepID=A0AAV0EH74_9ASTE|nr:unnamed protein product [Cuscuta epithymum]CAH9123135.1 unnamed protein product [Cuscuta epithymum]
MGVHGLWELLAPVGRRVSVETLVGKRLAIDASIWMIQFMKAMREEKGDMVRNAHLLGFFRRICKLLYLRTKPVFVFDGGTPALKRRTVIARRRQRENAQAKIRKTAEKLLLNHLKAMRLKELAADLDNQREKNASKGKSVVSEDTDTVQEMSDGHCFSANLEKQQNENDPMGKKVVHEESDAPKKISQENAFASNGVSNQSEIDEMLAASIAAEEDDSFFPDASTSAAGANEDDDEDEEMILPAMHGKIDPSVLAALPPSMQLDLLVQMRERLMAENRQKYQKVKKAPEKFSELQIQAYLKTVAFRREIDEVHKSASGKGIGGVKVSRIASEANREFIFSSSFTGDKQTLTSAGENQNKNQNNLMETPRENCSATMAKNDTPAQKSSVALESFLEEPEGIIHDDVETYLDERGRVRVSRVRAMGIRMTRDLQRNLDLMKEIEQERVVHNKNASHLPNDSTVSSNTATPHEKTKNLNSSNTNHGQMTCGTVENEASLLKSGTSLEISFEEEKGHNGGDDDLFDSLVRGTPILDFSISNSALDVQWEEGDTQDNLGVPSGNSASDVEWEEGDTQYNLGMQSDDFRGGSELALTEGGVLNDESEVEWEEGSLDIHKGGFSFSCEGRNASKGDLDEEANFQEAIRRSLQDTKDQRSVGESSTGNASHNIIGDSTMGTILESDWQQKSHSKHELVEFEILHQPDPHLESLTYIKANGTTDGLEITDPNNSLNTHLDPESIGTPRQREILKGKAYDDNVDASNHVETQLTRPVIDNMGQGGISTGTVYSESQFKDLGGSGNLSPKVLEEAGNDLEEMREGMVGMQSGHTINEEASDDLICDTELRKTYQSVPVSDTCSAQRSDEEQVRDRDDIVGKRDEFMGSPVDGNIQRDHVEFTAESLEEEIITLGEERKELVNEQRRLERNAESVTSEMFAECQELLQIFGLPYIIAPMEAEAQCAYMELVDLVDGVVTDDSDAFLFGARCVYKNIFDDRKYVETYLMKDIENEIGLDREKLIHMAMLLGSDYTEGVSGIGIVNAIEVLNAFPEKDGLRKFREWVESPDPTILGKVDVQAGCSSSNILQPVDDHQKIKQIFMNKHRNVSKNWHIPSSFPSDAVVSAYDTPQVDKSKESFSWGKPDVSVLRKLCWEKFGWTIQKTNELITPVLKEYNKHETQLRLEAFYAFNERFAKIRSTRIKKAVKGMTCSQSLELMDDTADDTPARKRKQKVKPNDDEKGNNLKPGNGDENKIAKKASGKKARKSKGDLLQSEGAGSRKRPKAGVQCPRGRQRRKISHSRSNETSSADGIDSDMGEAIDSEKLEPSHVRRSVRPRKIVSYTDDLEDDEYSKVDYSISDEQLTGRESMEWKEMESDSVQLGDGESNNPVEQLSKDYLESGGGFCLEEEDETNRGFGDDNTTTPQESADFSHRSSDREDNIETEVNVNETANEYGSKVVNSQDNNDLILAASSLRAMPNLRRKRKI